MKSFNVHTDRMNEDGSYSITDKMMNNDNPFYSNHIFTEFDKSRITIKKWKYPLLWFLPTYVQIAEGGVYHYKRWNGRYYLMKVEAAN